METLHSALQQLGPIDFDDISRNDDDLRAYASNLLAYAYLAVESVPPADKNRGSGRSSDGIKNPEGPMPITVGKPVDMATLQKAWGKPINKVDNEKENPLQIPVYKLASRDGKGAWFARRSVHEGLPFERWKEKLQDEFEETMRIRERNGGSLKGGSIREIGCERRIDKIEVPRNVTRDDNCGGVDEDDDDDERENLALMEVYHLSASFAGPSTPRDFVTMLVTSNMTANVGFAGMESNRGSCLNSAQPRMFMIVSKPCRHRAAPPRKGFIRGQYESIEFIRELSNATDDGPNGDEKSDGSDRKAELVEWVMITRSDPGGSIPRWMVEKGTVPSIIDDARKFVEWASREDREDGPEERLSSSSGSRRKSTQYSSDDFEESDTPNIANLIDGVVGLVLLVLYTMTPRVVRRYIDQKGYDVHGLVSPFKTWDGGRGNGSQNCSCSCHRGLVGDTLSAGNVPFYPKENVYQHISTEGRTGTASTSSEAPSVALSSSSVEQSPPARTRLNKELAKLARRKKSIEDKLNALHEEERSLRQSNSPTNRNDDNSPRPSTSSEIGPANANVNAGTPSKKTAKASAANFKRLSSLEQEEAKLTSQIEKIEFRQDKITAQIESKRRKEAQKNERRSSRIEIENLKDETKRLKSEVHQLREERERWVELIGRLQKENTRLAAERGESR
ncbi:hypothetical protein VTO42DRAFT_49 [Malbranchea cinnamomea]